MSLTLRSKHTRILSMVLVLVLLVGICAPLGAIRANAASSTDLQTTPGTNTYSLFNSGRTGSATAYRQQQGADYNPNSRSYNNSGYDIYGQMPSGGTVTLGMGLSFTINEAVTELARLTVNAYDVDEEQGEYDYVTLVDETNGSRVQVGALSGMNNEWNVTELTLAPTIFTTGHTYHFEVTISNRSTSSSYVWLVYLRTVSLQLTTAGQQVVDPVVPTVTEYDFSASISNSGYVTTNLYLKSNLDVSYSLEYGANLGSNQHGSSLNQSVTVTPAGVTKTVGFQLESAAPSGSYTVIVILKDSAGNTVTTYRATAGYSYRAVNYNSNGGSQNLPTDTNTYSSGNTVTVKFDYIPSRAGYNFLGWATSSTATTPEFTENGNKTFTIGSSDVTLYAVWGEVQTHTHTAGEWIVDIEPTCTTDGSRCKLCTDCGEELERETIAASSDYHVESEWYMNPDVSCTTAGYKYKLCTVCGAKVVEAVMPAIGHGEGVWVVDAEPTCTTDGERRKVCVDCGEELSREIIPAGGHAAGEWVIDAPATCTTDGSRYKICPDCSAETARETIPALGHTESDWIIDTPVTCYADGAKHKVCTVCGVETARATILSVGHVASDWIVDLRPTCTAPGSQYKTCTECHLVLESGVEIPMLSHTESEWFVDSVATCTTDGVKIKKCTVCSEELARETVAASADYHVESAWIVDIEPTVNHTGRRHIECTVCGVLLSEQVIPALANIVVGSAGACPGGVVAIPVTVYNNPGLTAIAFNVNYAYGLELVAVTAGEAWQSFDFTEPASYESGCRFVWDNSGTADSTSGVVLTLVFKVSAYATNGTPYEISVSDIDSADENLGYVAFKTASGSITIDKLLGDVNGDGVVDVADVVTLRRYFAGGYDISIDEGVADVNEDGEISVYDIIELRRLLV